ncbi:MAG: hypothetical protein GH149_05260, partial [Methanosarcinales archaeon]|nr:hypothetical protein [Methanosarcinales archaeon]
MNTRYIAIPIVMIAVLALAALSTPAMAAPCKPAVSTSGAGSYGTNGSLNGTVYVDGDGESELGDDYELVNFEDIPDGVTIKWARVYWHIWGGNPDSGGWTNATFCNATQCWTDNQSIPAVNGAGSPNNCQNDETDGFYMGGSGTHWVYWNVTDKVSAGSNNITVDNTNWWDGRCMWVYMVAVLENTTKYSEMHYWVNQGYEDLGATTSTTWFNGPVTTGRNGTLWHLALTAGQSEGVYFNNHKVHNGIPRTTVTKEIIPSGWIENDNTQNMMWDNTESTDPSVHPVMGIFMDKVEQDLTVTEIDVGTPRPNHASTIKATVKNWGSVDIDNQFNVSLYANDVLKSTKQTVASLNAGSSTEVSFTGVNLPKGCYDFKVIADIDGDIPESNENNNATTVKAHVGYVIVVESYSDFDDLVTESNNGLLGAGSVSHSGNTYYIQNFTGTSAIVNCAGNGITIKNLNATTKFVINNCTIENCAHSGVYLHNLSNGTINGSKMLNNSYYGIKVGEVPLGSDDPDHVNITNNTINGSKIDGIDLIGLNCTVKKNTISNSTTYGIYLFGNYTNITYNTIRDNGNYGIKAYNSYNNNIDHNNFI